MEDDDDEGCNSVCNRTFYIYQTIENINKKMIVLTIRSSTGVRIGLCSEGRKNFEKVTFRLSVGENLPVPINITEKNRLTNLSCYIK